MKTTNYEISKQLAEIGFKAESDIAVDKKGQIIHNGFTLKKGEYLAYDLETILEAFPETVAYFHKYSEGNYRIDLVCLGLCEDKKENESLADVAAKLLIKMHEEGLINFEEVK